MKSFRLDGASVAEFLDSWPALVLAALLGGLVVLLGSTHPYGRVVAVLLCGICGGYRLRGVTYHRIREQYPGARWAWLLSIGMTTLIVGVVTRIAFPQVQGPAFDLTWVLVSFSSILIFVIVNRTHQDILH